MGCLFEIKWIIERETCPDPQDYPALIKKRNKQVPIKLSVTRAYNIPGPYIKKTTPRMKIKFEKDRNISYNVNRVY